MWRPETSINTENWGPKCQFLVTFLFYGSCDMQDPIVDGPSYEIVGPGPMEPPGVTSVVAPPP